MTPHSAEKRFQTTFEAFPVPRRNKPRTPAGSPRCRGPGPAGQRPPGRAEQPGKAFNVPEAAGAPFPARLLPSPPRPTSPRPAGPDSAPKQRGAQGQAARVPGIPRAAAQKRRGSSWPPAPPEPNASPAAELGAVGRPGGLAEISDGDSYCRPGRPPPAAPAGGGTRYQPALTTQLSAQRPRAARCPEAPREDRYALTRHTWALMASLDSMLDPDTPGDAPHQTHRHAHTRAPVGMSPHLGLHAIGHIIKTSRWTSHTHAA